jgi:hypothetical protein
MPVRPEPLTPAERTLLAQMAAHAKWAKVEDATAATAAGRKAFLDRFEKQVDPDLLLTQKERARRASHARKAHMLLLALKSSQARRRKAQGSGGDAA